MNGTYIKLYRRILDWEWYSDTNCVRVFLHLLLKANWEDSEYQGISIPRGSVVVGRRTLSDQLGLSEQQIRTTIKRLLKSQSINQQVTSKFSVVSICNFDTYNPEKTASNQQVTNNQPASNQQVTTSKEDKNIKRKEKLGFFEGIDLSSLPQYRITGEKKTLQELQRDARLAKQYGIDVIQ